MSQQNTTKSPIAKMWSWLKSVKYDASRLQQIEAPRQVVTPINLIALTPAQYRILRRVADGETGDGLFEEFFRAGEYQPGEAADDAV